MSSVVRKLFRMSPAEGFLRAALAATPLHDALNTWLRRQVSNPDSRTKLNSRYLKLNYLERALFHALFSRAFRDVPNSLQDGEWLVEFRGKQLRMPLRSSSMWLDWDSASAITGHDIDVKAAYEALLEGNPPPRVFFDIGTNYGTHSLLMLSQGMQVVSFEPNPACHEFFKQMCELNDVAPVIEGAAVGDVPGKAEFWFPAHDTWLGSMVNSTKEQLEGEFDLEKIDVRVTTVDEFVAKTGIEPDVIKIDTEGNEEKVLRGAAETIRKKKPVILFEANVLSDRTPLWEVIRENPYEIAELTVGDSSFDPKWLTIDEFISSRGGNFIAFPRG
ncbi:MAG TPA: FkbM family methyltransferase [Pyrinomonadaceae bacterium]|nr:FkbM family methyltransferase [Pyrinomonadaceae bacterium]